MKQLLLIVSICICPTMALAGDLVLTETDESIRITQRGKPILEYVKVARPVPDGLPQHFSRSGYLHPIYTPTGQVVSGDFAADHPHQHGLFFAWTKTTFDGRKVDFWNQAKQQGGVEFRGIVETHSEPDKVSFTTKHAFTVGTGDDRIDALTETWTVTVHQTPDDYFLFDIKSVQECASDEPLVMEEYHYGGMAFRGNEQWLTGKDSNGEATDFRFLTSEGKERKQGNHTQPNWVSMSGTVDDKEASITVFGNPENFRAPQYVRLHPTKPYFCFAPMVAGKFTIEPGQKYVSKYRYLVTSTIPDEAVLREQWLKSSTGN